MNVDSILQPFQQFGVHLGLKRIQQLLANLDNPHHQVPIVHVAGTNGKGSVCAYLSTILTEAGYRVGRFISPHLVDWTERICLNEQPISPEELQQLLLKVQAAIQPGEESPTQFEAIAAAAWLYFAQQRVDVAVVEVGLGGRLDATNVCDRPLVSIITSISWEHWQVLGPTLADIAREKAGILKPGCPAVIGLLPEEAKAAVEKRIAELGCPAVWPEAAVLKAEFPPLPPSPHPPLFPSPNWASYQGIDYPLPIAGDVQLANSAVAIAALLILREEGWEISDRAIATGMAKTKWPGRIQWVSWRDRLLLIDGAHNADSARALRRYVDTQGCKSVTWIMGMMSGKDYSGMFEALLRSLDRLYLVPVPADNSAIPEELALLAVNICPELAESRCYPDVVPALESAVNSLDNLTVLCGSLYLIGYFLKNL